ncbi:MAG: hypothetical protein ACK5TA_08625, partial [bacterium]
DFPVLRAQQTCETFSDKTARTIDHHSFAHDREIARKWEIRKWSSSLDLDSTIPAGIPEISAESRSTATTTPGIEEKTDPKVGRRGIDVCDVTILAPLQGAVFWGAGPEVMTPS